MNKSLILTSLILILSGTTIFSQKVLFTENFIAPLKWKVSSGANGSKTYEKEGSESIMKVEAFEGKEFQASIKVPAIQPTTKEILIEFEINLNEVYNSQVVIGESPNRLWVIAEKNKTLRLAGEAIQMSDGAKFLNASPDKWHKMVIRVDLQRKQATFTIDGNDSKVVDLNQQPNKSYQFIPSALVVKSLKGGVVKVKSIKITEI